MSSTFNGAALRRHRIRRGLTQFDVADDMGSTVATISRWETGASQPLVGPAFDLAATLGIPLAELMVTRELS
jgi:transcriptional regulator with XRE-family HTH domain